MFCWVTWSAEAIGLRFGFMVWNVSDKFGKACVIWNRIIEKYSWVWSQSARKSWARASGSAFVVWIVPPFKGSTRHPAFGNPDSWNRFFNCPVTEQSRAKHFVGCVGFRLPFNYVRRHKTSVSKIRTGLQPPLRQNGPGISVLKTPAALPTGQSATNSITPGLKKDG